MAGKLLSPVRFLNPSPPVARFIPMTLHSAKFLCGGRPILSWIFPFKLKHKFLCSLHEGGRGFRRSSTREYRGSSSKSIIEDEAELSDYSDSGKGRGLGREMGRGRGSSGFRREGESDFGGSRRPGRGDTSLFREHSDRGSRGGTGREMGRDRDSGLGQMGSDFGDFKRGGGFKSSTRNSRGNMQDSVMKRRYDSDLDEEYEDDDDDDDDNEEEEDEDEDENEDAIYSKGKVVNSASKKRTCLITSPAQMRKLRRSGVSLSEEGTDDEEYDDEDDDLGDISKIADSKPSSSVHASPRKSSSGEGESYLSESSFDQFGISPLSLKAIKNAGFEKMTVVQEATLPLILKGKDVLAKARTGTGKTVAFLLPSIEVASKSPPTDRDPIIALVICPTRELASQAAKEANMLLKYHSSIGVQVVIGGVRPSIDQKRMQANPCQILVATPGRLKDHIENTAGFANRLKGVKILVLDEADQLLDMGFRQHIEDIISSVPKQRQTLLFSATVPPEVRRICHIALKKDHEYIDTVPEGSEETHSKVTQTHMVAPLDKQFPVLYALLKDHIADDADYKVLVFCTTAMVTSLVAELLRVLKLNVREIHSRKTQSYRTAVSDEFRKSKGLILVTSDVSARGVDYPDVTLVVQVGAPSNRQQYIHRLGRTGRKGKEGQGILLLAPWEEFFLSSIKDLPLTKASLPLLDPDMTKRVMNALSKIDMKTKASAYQAWLGYYNSNKNVGGNKIRLVELVNEFSRSMGLSSPPAIKMLVLHKMGLKNVPGLRTE